MKKIIICTLLIIGILTGCGGSQNQNEEVTEEKTYFETPDFGDVHQDVIDVLNDWTEVCDEYIAFMEEYNAMSEDEQMEHLAEWSAAVSEYGRHGQIINEQYQNALDDGYLTEADKIYWNKVTTDNTLRVLEALDSED